MDTLSYSILDRGQDAAEANQHWEDGKQYYSTTYAPINTNKYGDYEWEGSSSSSNVSIPFGVL